MTLKSFRNIILNSYYPAHTYSCNTLVAFIFTISRPPVGIAGYIDWITDGGISDIIIKGKFLGDYKECLLFVTEKKIKASTSLFIGAGNPECIDLMRIKDIGRHVGRVVNGLKISHFGLYPHDLFLSHLDKLLVLYNLIEGISTSITNDIIIAILSSTQEQKDFIEHWLQIEDHENYNFFRHTQQFRGALSGT